MSNVEGMYSVYFKKTERSLRLVGVLVPTPRRAKPPFEILRFDIRYSAVRCLIQAIETASLVTKKTCHFGRVSYKAGFQMKLHYASVTSYETSYEIPPGRNSEQIFELTP